MRHFRSLLLVSLLLLPTVPARAQTGASISVRYRSAETIYLDAGKAAGVDVGDRLEVLRGDKVIAEIEVVYAANASASARVLSEREPIRPGDRVRMLGDTSLPPAEQESPAAAPTSPRTAPRDASQERPADGYRLFRPARTRVTGALTFDWESWTNRSDAGRDADRTTARLNLRVRDIAGTPLQLRLRMRSREVNRERDVTQGIPEGENRDRLYEAALIWNPPDGRFDLRLGRMGTSPFVGLGYVDGAVAAFKVTDWLAVGGVFGSRPEIEELGFASSGSKAGAFIRLTPSGRDADRGLDLLLAGLREEGDLGVSREYVTLETHYDSGGPWSFFQHAEVDLNNDWRELAADEPVQLSTVSLTALRRLASGNRIAISYQGFQPYLTEEDRLSPVEAFDDLYRQGLRASWQTGRTDGLNLSVDAGLRTREEAVIDPRFGISEARETYSLGLGVHHPRLPGLGIFAGANVLGYSSSFADGVVVQTRAGRRLGAGHELSLALGGNLYRTPFEENHTLAWGRASLWLELPLDLFGQADFELLTGDDDVEGQRLRVGLGYRF